MSRKPNPKIDAQAVRHTEPTKLEIVPPTPEQEKPLKIVKDEQAMQLPMSVGNPDAAADLAIDQSHMEEFATVEDSPSEVVCDKPPKGIFFTVRPETVKPWKDRAFYFLLQIKDRDPYIIAPGIAKQRKDEDVIRPVLLVRYVTMTGDEGLWPLKLDPPDGKSNLWNRSALTALEVASEGKWVRLMSSKGHYRYQTSGRTFAETPPRFSARSFQELVNSAFPKDRAVHSLDHEIWDMLDNGSDK